MTDFNLKQWLFENRLGAYGKASLLREFDSEDGFSDETTNRGDMNEINPAALGVGQAVADAEMQKQDDDERGDMVDNASMGVVAEDQGNTDVQIEEWEVNILGKDHIIDADVSVDFHYEGADYEDHMEINPGGYYVDNATAVITKLGVEDGDDYRYVTDPVYIKQIQDLINKDPKLNRKLEDTAANSIDWSRLSENMEETVGYVMKTKPSDPLERGE